MVRIAMSAAAYDAIASTLPRGLSGPSFFRAATVPHPRRGGRPRPSEGHAWTGLWTLCNWGFKPDADDCNGGTADIQAVSRLVGLASTSLLDLQSNLEN